MNPDAAWFAGRLRAACLAVMSLLAVVFAGLGWPGGRSSSAGRTPIRPRPKPPPRPARSSCGSAANRSWNQGLASWSSDGTFIVLSAPSNEVKVRQWLRLTPEGGSSAEQIRNPH
jgi:hypothetical protein